MTTTDDPSAARTEIIDLKTRFLRADRRAGELARLLPSNYVADPTSPTGRRFELAEPDPELTAELDEAHRLAATLAADIAAHPFWNSVPRGERVQIGQDLTAQARAIAADREPAQAD
jgi:hypothetical protein